MSEKRKRILSIVPLVSDVWNELTKEVLEKYLSPGFEMDMRNVRYGGMESTEGVYYIAVTVPYIVDEIIEAEKEGYDAVITLCFLSPGVTEGRELVSIPVVGAGEAAFYVALMCGDRLGIVTVGGTYRTPSHSSVMHVIRQLVRVYGISERVVSLRATGLAVEDSGQAELVLDALYREGQKAIEDGAEVIILGCTGMSPYTEELQKRLDVPVIDPSVAALKFAELLITMNLTHSKLTIPSPAQLGAKCVVKWPPTLREYPR